MLDHPALQSPTAWTVWTKLLLKAAHKQCRVTWRGQTVPLVPGEVVLSVRQFSEQIGVPYKAARVALNRFTREGMIKDHAIYGAVQGAGGGAVGTKLSICNWARYQGDDDNKGAVQGAVKGATGAQPGRTEQEGKKDSDSSLRSESSPPSLPRRRNVYPEAFQQFWLAYPTRGTDTKADAFKAWDKARQAGTDVATLQSGAERYAAFAGSTGCETKHVQTWMNKQGWTASYERKPNGNGFARPGNQRASIVDAIRELDELDEDRAARARAGSPQVRREGHEP